MKNFSENQGIASRTAFVGGSFATVPVKHPFIASLEKNVAEVYAFPVKSVLEAAPVKTAA